MKTWLQISGFVLASLAPLTEALASYSPLSSSTSPKFSAGIPSGSTISQTTKGSLYLSIVAPTSYQWVGLGIGTQMASATIFVVYEDGAGNVTVSGRNGGRGHIQPTLDTALMTGVTVLEGTGVTNGIMTANIHCTTCVLDSDSSSSSSPFITAWMEGSPLNSKDVSFSINRHSSDSTSQFTFDLSKATLSSDSNPFVASSPSASSGPSGTAASNPSSTSSVSVSDPDSGSSAANIGPSFKTIKQYQEAHGIIMAATVVVLFPAGAIFIRTVRHPWIHAAIQIFSLCMMVVGLALGIKLAQFTHLLFKQPHTILGIALLVLLIVQPFLGLIHHYLFTKTQSRSAFSHLHIWYGRLLMILCVINGGFGLHLAENSNKGKIAYAVVSGIMGVLYIAAVLLKRRGSRSASNGRNKEAAPRAGT